MIDYTLDEVRDVVKATSRRIVAGSCGMCIVSRTVQAKNPDADVETAYDMPHYRKTGILRGITRINGEEHELSHKLACLAYEFDEAWAGSHEYPVSKDQVLQFIDQFEERYNG